MPCTLLNSPCLVSSPLLLPLHSSLRPLHSCPCSTASHIVLHPFHSHPRSTARCSLAPQLTAPSLHSLLLPLATARRCGNSTQLVPSPHSSWRSLLICPLSTTFAPFASLRLCHISLRPLRFCSRSTAHCASPALSAFDTDSCAFSASAPALQLIALPPPPSPLLPQLIAPPPLLPQLIAPPPLLPQLHSSLRIPPKTTCFFAGLRRKVAAFLARIAHTAQHVHSTHAHDTHEHVFATTHACHECCCSLHRRSSPVLFLLFLQSFYFDL